MNRCEKERTWHQKFGKGWITAKDHTYCRVRFDKATGGKRVRVFRRVDIEFERVTKKKEEQAQGAFVEVCKIVAAKMYNKTRPAEDQTAAERCFRELIIAMVAGHEGLFKRAWRGLMTIANKAVGNLTIPLNTSRQAEKDKPIVHDGRQPHTYDIAAVLLVKWMNGDIEDLPYRNWGRFMRHRKIDELRKAFAAKRTPAHNLADEEVPPIPVAKNELVNMWKTGKPGKDTRRHRKSRSDKGGKHTVRKPRSDKGKYRGKRTETVLKELQPWKLRPIKGLKVPEETEK